MNRIVIFIGLTLALISVLSCTKEIRYDSLGETLANRSWNVEESYIRYENGDTTFQVDRSFTIDVNSENKAYVEFLRDTVTILPTEDQKYVFWILNASSVFSNILKFEVTEWNYDYQRWFKDDIEFQNDMPFSGSRIEFLITAI